VTQGFEGTTQAGYIDPLASAKRVAPVTDHCDAQWGVGAGINQFCLLLISLSKSLASLAVCSEQQGNIYTIDKNTNEKTIKSQ